LSLGRRLKKQQRLACPYSLLITIAYSSKEKERTDKKAAKVERERKDKEAQEKARSMMASFFGKPKPSTASASSSKDPAPSASTTLSEFDRVFKPFTLKKDVELAPTNWFQEAKRRKRFADADVIVIDDDGTASEDCDIEMIECELSPDANIRRNICFIWLLTVL
jgi:chromatin assembly factor 1 subunit A